MSPNGQQTNRRKIGRDIEGEENVLKGHPIQKP